MFKRMISLILALVMVLSMMPLYALAENLPEETEEQEIAAEENMDYQETSAPEEEVVDAVVVEEQAAAPEESEDSPEEILAAEFFSAQNASKSVALYAKNYEENEPNNNMGDADWLDPSVNVLGYVTGSDVDYFGFRLGSKCTIGIPVVSTKSTLSISLVDSSGKVIKLVKKGSPTNEGNYTYKLIETVGSGLYYVVIRDTNNSYNVYGIGLIVESVADSCKHSNKSKQVIKPTCGTEGYTLYVCRNCDLEWEDDYVPATGKHTYRDEYDSFCDTCSSNRYLGIARGRCYGINDYGEIMNWVLYEDGRMVLSGWADLAVNGDTVPWKSYKDRIKTLEIRGDIKVNTSAFEGCTNLTRVTMYGHVNMEYNVFYGCTNLETVTLSEGILRLASGVFGECTSLTTIRIPSTVHTINSGAFSGCSKLESIQVDSGNPYYSSYQGLLYDKNKTVLQIIPAAVNGQITIPDSVTQINGSFSGCSGVTQVNLPKGISTLPSSFFSNCSALQSVTLPESLKQIPSYLFNGCYALKEVTIPRDVTAIGSYAFKDCNSLKSVTLPEGLLNIGEKAFEYCSSLEKIVIPKTVTSIGYHAFRECGHMMEVTFMGNPPAIDSYAFSSVTATAYYPIANAAWTESLRKNYGGTLTWVGDCIGSHLEVIDTPGKAPTCTENGMTPDSHCSACNQILSVQDVIPALGHTEVPNTAVAPTCTETGLTEGKYCSVCSEILIVQEIIPANGHTEIIDKAVAPTCTEIGLAEGKHCSVCNTVLLAQEEIPALGHDFGESSDIFECLTCGHITEFDLMQTMILLDDGEVFDLKTTVNPAEIRDEVRWSLEGDETVVSLSADGTATAQSVGSVYVIATYGESYSDRIRIDVDCLDAISGIQLSSRAVTSELYSTDYAAIEVLFHIPQERTTFAVRKSGRTAGHGVAIDSVRFTDETSAAFFDLVAKDDRTVMIVPTQSALENAKELKSRYTSAITVTVDGRDYRSEPLTITLKKTLPKLKVTVPAFNSFYAGQAQEMVITGATATSIEATDMVDWLTLEGQTLTLNENAPAQSVSGKVNLLVYTEEWRVPTAVTLTVKNSYKAAALKLSASSVTLNTAIRDQVTVTLTANPTDFDISGPAFRLTDSTGKVAKHGELTVSYENGRITVGTTATTRGNYKLFVSVGNAKEAVLTVKTIAKVPTVSFKVTGNPDISIPGSRAAVTPTFKNYSSSFQLVKMTAETPKGERITEQFTAVQEENTIFVDCKSNTAEGSYVLELQLALADGSKVTNTAKITVKKSALKLKLSNTKLTLNKAYGDIGSVTVTSATKGYTLEQPVWQLMDKTGKNPAEGKVDIRYTDGKLYVAVNEGTEYGATYKLLVKAGDSHPAQTLTVSILAYNKSDITSTLKASGGIDVIRETGSIVITPSYKNLNAQTAREEKLMFCKSVGKESVDVSDLFHYTANADGSFTVVKAENAKLDHSGKYTVVLMTLIDGRVVAQSKPATLSVKMGSAKLTVTAVDTCMFSQDTHDRAAFVITTTDTTLNDINSVEIRDAKYKNLLEIIDYGNGEYGMGFKDGKVDNSLVGKTFSVNLDIFLKGNETVKANATAKLKVTVIE